MIEAIAARNGIDMKDLTVVNVGFDKAPLVRGASALVRGAWHYFTGRYGSDCPE